MAPQTQRENPTSVAESFTGPTLKLVLLLGLLALTLSIARVAIFRSGSAIQGQGYMYKNLGRAIASGQGYAEISGVWRGHPTIMRPPLWPFVLALPMKICSDCDPTKVTEVSTAFPHAATALAVGLLVGRLSGSRRRMLLAFLVTALLPEVQPFFGGYCEPLAAALLVIGALLLSSGERYFLSGVFVLSLLPLVRPNFLPLWFVVTALIWWLKFHTGSRLGFGNNRRMLVAGVLFCIPSAAWVTRNYMVSGAFPVLAGTSSMTFYGNYNSFSATLGPRFGSWIDPGEIPGEEKKDSLLQRMSETEMLRYWDSKGKQFIAQHWKMIPLLVVAHVVHTLLPSRLDGAHKYSFWVLRLLLYLATCIAIWRNGFRWDSWFNVLLAGTALTIMITVLLYSGDGRYLYPLNILLVVFVCSARYRTFARTGRTAQEV